MIRRAGVTTAILVCLLMAPLAGLAKDCALPAAEAAKAREVSNAYGQAWLKNDPKAILDTLTSDAVLMPPGIAPISGMEEIKKFWWPVGGPATTITGFQTQIDEVGGCGDTAFVRGRSQFTFTSEENGKTTTHTSSNKYLMILKRQADGRWRIFRRMWNPQPKA